MFEKDWWILGLFVITEALAASFIWLILPTASLDFYSTLQLDLLELTSEDWTLCFLDSIGLESFTIDDVY